MCHRIAPICILFLCHDSQSSDQPRSVAADARPRAVVSACDVPLLLPPMPVGAAVQSDEGIPLSSCSEPRGELQTQSHARGRTLPFLHRTGLGVWAGEMGMIRGGCKKQAAASLVIII